MAESRRVKLTKRLIKEAFIELLEEKGCTDGHTVNIYGFEFDFVK